MDRGEAYMKKGKEKGSWNPREKMLGERVSDPAREAETSSIYSNESVKLDNHVQATIIYL